MARARPLPGYFYATEKNVAAFLMDESCERAGHVLLRGERAPGPVIGLRMWARGLEGSSERRTDKAHPPGGVELMFGNLRTEDFDPDSEHGNLARHVLGSLQAAQTIIRPVAIPST